MWRGSFDVTVAWSPEIVFILQLIFNALGGAMSIIKTTGFVGRERKLAGVREVEATKANLLGRLET